MNTYIKFLDHELFHDKQRVIEFIENEIKQNLAAFETYNPKKMKYELLKIKGSLFCKMNIEMFYRVDAVRQEVFIELKEINASDEVSPNIKLDLNKEEEPQMEKVQLLIMEARGEINSVIPFVRNNEIEDSLQVAKQKLDEADKISVIKDRLIISLLETLGKRTDVNYNDLAFIDDFMQTYPEMYEATKCLFKYYTSSRKNNK